MVTLHGTPVDVLHGTGTHAPDGAELLTVRATRTYGIHYAGQLLLAHPTQLITKEED